MKQTNLTRDHSDAVTRGLVAATAARSFSWVEELANDSGVDIVEGQAVVVLADGTIELASTDNDPRPTGIALDDIDDGDSGQVCFGGPVDLVSVSASVTGGQYGQTSTTPGEVQVTGSVGRAFLEFTSSGTEPSAFLWGGRGGGGAVAGVVIEDFPTDETDVTLVLHPDGTGGIEWGVDATGGSGGGYRVNIVDYGAVADSSTDNSVALQAAINATTEYGTVWIPDGQGDTYDFASTLTIPHSLRFLGEGSYPGFAIPASTLRMTTANTTAISSTVLAAKVGVNNAGIEGPSGGSSGYGIYSTSDVELVNARVNGFYDNVCIDVTGGTPSGFYAKIAHSWINFATRASVYLKGNVNNAEIFGNHLSDSAYGILADGGMYGCWITHNAIELHSSAGIQIDGTSGGFTASGVSIIGNYFEQSTLHGTPTADLKLGPTTAMRGVYVAGNKFVESDVTGLTHINANKIDGLTLVGNDVGSNAETGSLLCDASNTTNVTLIGNKFAGLVTTPASTRILDETDVTPVAVDTANAVGTSKYLARATHVHQGAPYGADYLVGTAQAGLSAEIVVGTSPGGELGNTWASPTVDTTHSGSSHADAIATAEAYTDAAIASAGGSHAHVVGETHLSDGSTTTYTLDQQFEPGSVEAFNTTTLAYLVVTEADPDQATVSAAGSVGDKITFSYAATVA